VSGNGGENRLVIGRDFAFRILQTIAGIEKELKANLLNLQGLEFIYEKSLFPELEYIFKHALTQEVAYNSLLMKRRKAIHENVGKAIEELYTDRITEFYEMLAHHFSKSEDKEKAYQYLKLSGDKAVKKYSNWEAFRFYEEALDVLHQSPKTEDNNIRTLLIVRRLSIPLEGIGYPEKCLHILKEGEKLSKEIGDEQSLTVIYSMIGQYYNYRGNLIKGTKYAEKCLEKALKVQNVKLMVQMSMSLCFTYYSAGNMSKVVNAASKVIDVIKNTNREKESFSPLFNVYSALCSMCGSAVGISGNFSEGIDICENGRVNAEEIGDITTLGYCELHYGILYFYKSDWKLAKIHLQNSLKHLEQAGWDLVLVLGYSLLGLCCLALNEFKSTLNYLRKSNKIHRKSGIQLFLSVQYLHFALYHFESGDLKKAIDGIEEALKLSKKNGEKNNEGISMLWMGKFLGKIDLSQSDKAKEFILKGVKILEQLKVKSYASVGYLFLGELYSDIDRKEMALKHIDKADAMFKEMGMEYWHVQAQILLNKLKPTTATIKRYG